MEDGECVEAGVCEARALGDKIIKMVAAGRL